MCRLGDCHWCPVLQFVADILTVSRSDVLHELLKRRAHLVCGCLVSVVKYVGSKGRT